jgi:8-oxo-dGTP pyrophosphatase MutT (NUDIX family)
VKSEIHALIASLVSDQEAPSETQDFSVSKITEAVLALVRTGNDGVSPERRATVKSALIVAERSLVASANRKLETRAFNLVRDVNNFITLSKEGRVGELAPTNTDLLSIGHPLSTAPHSMGDKELRIARSRWIATDPRISEEYRSMVASAYATAPKSLEQDFAIARLKALPKGSVPAELVVASAIEAITAGIGDGNSRAARRARVKLQWRNRRGRWVKMGRGVKFTLRMRDGKFKEVRGKFVGGTSDPAFGRVLVRNSGDANIPDAVYLVNSKNADSFEFELSEDVLKKSGIDADKAEAPATVTQQLDKDIQDIATIRTLAPNSLDDDLAGGATDEESAIAEELQKKSPIAKLPAGAEAESVPEEALVDFDKKSFPEKVAFNTDVDIPLVDERFKEFLSKDKALKETLDPKKFGKYLKSNSPVSDALTDFEAGTLSEKDLVNLFGESSYETSLGGKNKELSNVLQGLADYFEQDYDPQDYSDEDKSEPIAFLPETAPQAQEQLLKGFNYEKAKSDPAYVSSFLDGFDAGVYASTKKDSADWSDSDREGYEAGYSLGGEKYDEALEKAQQDLPQYGQEDFELESREALSEAIAEISKPFYDELEKQQADAIANKTEATEEANVVGERFTDWTVPAGAYPIQNGEPYEASGAISDIYGLDATDDPKVLASSFDSEILEDALAKSVAGTGDFDIDFAGAGQVPIPAEALYDALREQGVNADAVVAKAYDGISGKNDNQINLKSFREKAPQGEIAKLDAETIEKSSARELNQFLVKDELAGKAVDLIEAGKSGDEFGDADLQIVADSVNSIEIPKKQPKDFLERPVGKLLQEYLPWAFSDDESKKQAFRGLLGLITISDGNEGLITDKDGVLDKIFQASEFYDDSIQDPTSKLRDVIYPEGYTYTDFLKSKSKVATGIEDGNDPNSFAGATYKLAAKLSKERTANSPAGFARGILNPSQEAVDAYTTVGSVINMDLRPFSATYNEAAKFAKLHYLSKQPDAIIFRVDGPIEGISTEALSNYSEEAEILASGKYEVVEATKLDGPNENVKYADRNVYEVTLRKVAEATEQEPVAELPATKPSGEPEFYIADTKASELGVGDLIPKYYPTKGSKEAVEKRRAEDPNFRMPVAQEVLQVSQSKTYKNKVVVKVRDLSTNFGRSFEINKNSVIVDVRTPLEDSAQEQVTDTSSTLDDLSMTYDLKDYKQVSGALGSNKGGIFEDSTGKQIYVKEPKTDLHGDNEVLASALYELAGVPAVKVRNGELADGTKVTFSEMVPNSNADFADKVNDPEYRKKVQDGFVVDAWLANWDVAGTGFDNIVSDANNEPVRVDPGGALLFRAQGAPKGNAFNDKVTELDTLVDPSQNQWSAKTFQDMTEEDKVESAKKLLDISNEEIDNYVNASITDEEARTKLSDLLKARRQTIINRYSLEEGAEDGRRESGEPAGDSAGPEGQGDVPEGVGPRGGRDDGLADSDGNKEWATLDRKVEDNERVAELKAQGKNASDVYELDSERDAQAFKDGIENLKDGNPFFSSVYAYTVEEYKNMRLFMTADGTAGFALKGDDIVSVFVPEGPHKGSARSFIARAVGLGGRRLDAFDTNLPHIYSKEGFVPVSRLTWDEGQAPTTWDKEVYSEFNNGEPDVVFMAYDPERIDSKYDSSEGEYFVEYGDAVDAQTKFVEQKDSAPPKPTELTGYEIVQNENGVYSPERSVTSDDLYALRNGEKVPPNLPFIPVNTDSGDVTYYDSTGVRRWGQYGASGALLRKQNENGEFEFLITKRSNKTSTSPNKWSVPGGAHFSLDDKETTTTAKNELSEELGLAVAEGTRTNYVNQIAPDWSYTYEMLDVENLDDYEFKLSDEIVETKWVSAGELSQLQSAGELHEDFNEEVVSNLLELSNNKKYTPSTISSTKWWKHDKDENGNLIQFASKMGSALEVGDIINYRGSDLLVTDQTSTNSKYGAGIVNLVNPATGEKTNVVDLRKQGPFPVLSDNQSAQEQLKIVTGESAYNPTSGQIIDSANVDSPKSKLENGASDYKGYQMSYLNGAVTIMSYVLESVDDKGNFNYYKADPEGFEDVLYAEISPSGENIFDVYVSLDKPELLQKYSFETLEDAKAWVGESLAKSVGSDTNPINRGSLGEFNDIKPHKGGFLKPATENQIKLVKILLEEKQIDPELRDRINAQILKKNYVGGEAGSHISLLKSLEDLPEEQTEEVQLTTADDTLNSSYTLDLSDDTVNINLDAPSDQINPAKILDALQKSHNDSYYLDNGDLVVAERGYTTSYNKNYNYKLVVRRTKDKERFFAYVIKTNMQTGDVELLKASKEGHSYKTMMNKLKSAKLGIISSADPNTWFNKKKSKVETLLPDFDVSEKIEEVLSSKTDAELSSKIKEIIASLGSGASYSINKTVLDSLSKAVKNGSLSQKSLESIIEDMVISRIEQATSIPDYVLGNIDKIPPFPWMSFNGAQLKVGDTVDWTDIKTGKVLRGKVLSLKQKHGTKNYVYSDQTLVEFAELDKQRWRVSSNLVKVNEGDPISKPFYAKRFEYENQEKLVTSQPELQNVSPKGEETDAEPTENIPPSDSAKKYLGGRIFQIDEEKFVVPLPKEFATQSLALGEIRNVTATDLKPGDYMDFFEKDVEVLYKEDDKEFPDRLNVVVYSSESDSINEIGFLKTQPLSVVSGMAEKQILSKIEAAALVKRQNQALADLSNLQDLDFTENSAFYASFLSKLFDNLKTNSDIQQTLTNLKELSDAITKKANEIATVKENIVAPPITPAGDDSSLKIINYLKDFTSSNEGIIRKHGWDNTTFPPNDLDQKFYSSYGINENPFVEISEIEGVATARLSQLQNLTYFDIQNKLIEAGNKALYVHPQETYLESYEIDNFILKTAVGYIKFKPYSVVSEFSKDLSKERVKETMSSGVVLSVDKEKNSAKVAWRVGPKAGQEEEMSANDLYVDYAEEHLATPKYIEDNNLEIDKNYLEKVEERKKSYLTRLAKAYENAEKIVEYKSLAKKANNFDYGTGVSKFTPQSVLGWGETDFSGTVSLLDALKNIDSDSKLATNGQDVLVDAGDIEDNVIKVFKVVDQEFKTKEDFAKKIRLSFSLNPWAADAQINRLDLKNEQNNPDVEVYDELIFRKLFVNDAGNITSPVNEYDYSYELSGRNNGKTYKVAIKNSADEKIGYYLIYRADVEEFPSKFERNSSKPISYHNKVEIYLNENLSGNQTLKTNTISDIERALRFAGVEQVRPATKQDILTLNENKIISLFGGKEAYSSNYSGELRKKVLEDAYLNYGVRAEDIETVDKNGSIFHLLPESVGEKLASYAGLRYLAHDLTYNQNDGDTSDDYAKMFNYFYSLLSSNGLNSTISRWQSGVQSRGASSTTDATTLGSDYVFFRVAGEEEINNKDRSKFMSTLIFDASKLFRRLDFHSNLSDDYGFKFDSNQVDKLSISRSIGEVMFKDQVTWDMLFRADFSTKFTDELTKKFADNGVDTIGGHTMFDIFNGVPTNRAEPEVEVEVETPESTSSEDLKNKASALKKAYEDSDLRTLATASGTTKPVKGFGTSKTFVAKKPSKEAIELKNLAVETGASVLARADEIFEQKKLEIESKGEETLENQSQESDSQPAPQAENPTKDKLTKLVLDKLYSKKSFGWFDEVLGSDFYEYNGKENVKFEDKQEDSYVKQSVEYSGEIGQKYLAEKPGTQAWLKKNGLSLSKLKAAGVAEETLNRYISRGILNKVWDENGDFTKNNPDDSYSKFWKETVSRDGVQLTRTEALVNDLREISDYKDSISKAVKENLPIKNITKEDLLRKAKRDSLKEALEEAGVEFDSISLEQFGDRIKYSSSGKSLSSNKSQAYKSITEAFNFIPKKTLEKVLDYLDKKPLYIKTGVVRGHYSSGGSFSQQEITLSADRQALQSDETYTDTALHEFFHLIQRADQKMSMLEHAWLFDRVVTQDANGEEIVPAPFNYNRGTIEKYNGSEPVIPSNLPNYYISKYYHGRTSDKDESQITTLSQGNSASEVMTVGVQMFTNPDTYSEGRRLELLVKPSKATKDSDAVLSKKFKIPKRTVEVLEDGRTAYLNPADGKWYKDSAFTIPIDPETIVGQVGRVGRDDDYMSFVLGTLLGMS